MSHSLRSKLSGLRYKGILEDKDYKRLCHALEKENIYDDREHYITISRALYDKLIVTYDKALSQEPTDKSNLEKICEALAAENDDLRDQLAMRDRFKQQPCDDAISRDMALEKMADYAASGYADSAEDFEEYSRIICLLPSVTQKPKTGHWIYSDDDNILYDSYLCSECRRYITVDHKKTDDIGFVIEDMDYCPNCGARMFEPKESEE